MARYFIHINDGIARPDLDGSEIATLAEVETMVRHCLTEMMADVAIERNTFTIKIEVRDEAGHLVVGGRVDYTLQVNLGLTK